MNEDKKEENIKKITSSPKLIIPKLNLKQNNLDYDTDNEDDRSMPIKLSPIKNDMNNYDLNSPKGNSPNNGSPNGDFRKPKIYFFSPKSSPRRLSLDPSPPKESKSNDRKFSLVIKKKANKQMDLFLEEIELLNNDSLIKKDLLLKIKQMALEFIEKGDPAVYLNKLEEFDTKELNKEEKVLVMKFKLILSSITRLEEYNVKLFFLFLFFYEFYISKKKT